MSRQSSPGAGDGEQSSTMDQLDNAEPRHRAESSAGVPVPSHPFVTTPWFRSAIWTGRGLLVLTAIGLVVTRLTRDHWVTDGYDVNGFPISWLPNAVLVLVLVVGILWQWLFRLAASPAASWREGDQIVALTVLGRRRVRVQGARVLRFRLWSTLGTIHGAILLDRRLHPLVLVDPIRTGFAGTLDHLTETHSASSVGRFVLEYFAGFAWLLTTVIVVAALLASADLLTGALGRG
jgi:hypothetical protein